LKKSYLQPEQQHDNNHDDACSPSCSATSLLGGQTIVLPSSSHPSPQDSSNAEDHLVSKITIMNNMNTDNKKKARPEFRHKDDEMRTRTRANHSRSPSAPSNPTSNSRSKEAEQINFQQTRESIRRGLQLFQGQDHHSSHVCSSSKFINDLLQFSSSYYSKNSRSTSNTTNHAFSTAIKCISRDNQDAAGAASRILDESSTSHDKEQDHEDNKEEDDKQRSKRIRDELQTLTSQKQEQTRNYLKKEETSDNDKYRMLSILTKDLLKSISQDQEKMTMIEQEDQAPRVTEDATFFTRKSTSGNTSSSTATVNNNHGALSAGVLHDNHNYTHSMMATRAATSSSEAPPNFEDFRNEFILNNKNITNNLKRSTTTDSTRTTSASKVPATFVTEEQRIRNSIGMEQAFCSDPIRRINLEREKFYIGGGGPQVPPAHEEYLSYCSSTSPQEGEERWKRRGLLHDKHSNHGVILPSQLELELLRQRNEHEQMLTLLSSRLRTGEFLIRSPEELLTHQLNDINAPLPNHIDHTSTTSSARNNNALLFPTTSTTAMITNPHFTNSSNLLLNSSSLTKQCYQNQNEQQTSFRCGTTNVDSSSSPFYLPPQDLYHPSSNTTTATTTTTYSRATDRNDNNLLSTSLLFGNSGVPPHLKHLHETSANKRIVHNSDPSLSSYYDFRNQQEEVVRHSTRTKNEPTTNNMDMTTTATGRFHTTTFRRLENKERNGEFFFEDTTNEQMLNSMTSPPQNNTNHKKSSNSEYSNPIATHPYDSCSFNGGGHPTRRGKILPQEQDEEEECTSNDANSDNQSWCVTSTMPPLIQPPPPLQNNRCNINVPAVSNNICKYSSKNHSKEFEVEEGERNSNNMLSGMTQINSIVTNKNNNEKQKDDLEQSEEQKLLLSQTTRSSTISPTPVLVRKSRKWLPLGLNEDSSNLSSFLCFLRSECIEVFVSSKTDVLERMTSKKVIEGQVGIRCRFCAHLNQKSRVGRSSNFPSSTAQIYPGVSMMIYKHFTACPEMPPATKKKFDDLKNFTKKGNAESRSYWINSASRLGLIDTVGAGGNHYVRYDPTVSNLHLMKENK